VTARVHAWRYLDEVIHGRELFTLLAQCSLLRMRGYCVNALALLARYKGFEGRCASMEWNDMDASVNSKVCFRAVMHAVGMVKTVSSTFLTTDGIEACHHWPQRLCEMTMREMVLFVRVEWK